MAGLILTVRPIIRMGLANFIRAKSVIDGGHARPTQADAKEEIESELDSRANMIGLVMAFIGTFVWAYGDLVGGLP